MLEMETCLNETIEPVVESLNGSLTDTFQESLGKFINDIALPTVCVFGVVGNILNLTILTRRKLQKSFRSLEQSANLCLIALAVSDLMFCVLAFLFTFIPSDGVYHEQGVLYFYRMYSTALINLFIMESTMLTVAMSLERYMAICFPLRQDLYLNTRRIKYIIVGSFLFSLAFNVPVLWRFEGYQVCPNATTTDGLESQTTAAPAAAYNFSDSLISSSSAGLNDVKDPSIHLADTVHNALFSSRNKSLRSILLPTLSTPSSLSSSSSSSFLSSSSSHYPPHADAANVLLSSLSSLASSSSSSSPSSSSSSTSSPPSSFSPSAKRYRFRQVPLWGNQLYELAYRTCWAIVGNFIPLILLFFFNVCLCRNIYLSYKLRRQFKRQNQAKSSSHILTVTLVVIVVMFFILVAPSEIVLLCGISGSIEIIFNFMQSLNFSVNFILYCIISRHFRKTLKYLFLCGCYNIYQVSREWKKEFETSLM